MTNRDNDDRRLSRRSALQMTMGAFGLTALGPLDRAVAATGVPRAGAMVPPAGQKFLVVIELDGGNDGLNMCVPQGLSAYQAARPTLGLGDAETLAIDTGPFGTNEFRLHQRMPNLAQKYRDGELAIVRKVGYPNSNGSHDTSKVVWARGVRNNLPNANGWIARYAELEAQSALGAVAVNRGRHRSMVGGATNPLMLRSLSNFRYDVDTSFRPNHDHRLETIRQLLEERGTTPTRDALLAGHQLADELGAAVDNYVSTADYGTGRLADEMRDIARMLQAGFPTRVFYTGYGGFDTHAAQGTTTGRHPDLMQDLDDAIQGFSDDCQAMGIWDDCMICVISEFGRRNGENGSGGTDHGQASFMLVTGGAARGGLYGPAMTNADIEARSLPYGVDFRSVYRNVLEAHLGMSDPTLVFSEALELDVPINVVL